MKTTNKKTRKIRKIHPVMKKVLQFVMHQMPHLDEILARLLIVLYGLKLFPGADKAATAFAEEEPEGSNEHFDAIGYILLGLGLLQRFNEHLKGEEASRMKGECTTTLVATFLEKELGIEIPEIKELVASTLEDDSHGKRPRSRLSEVIKAANAVYPTNSAYVLQIGSTFLEAVIVLKRCNTAPVDGELTLKALFDLWKEKNDGKDADKKAIAGVGETVAMSMRRSNQVTELAYITTALYRRGCYSPEDIVKYMHDVFDILYTDQVQFNLGVEQLRASGQVKEPTLVQAVLRFGKNREEKKMLKLFICYGDTPQLHKAAFHLGADLVLQVNNSGNVQIHTKTQPGLSLANAVKMIRFLELPPAGKERATWKNLSQAGNYPGLGQWYYQREAQKLFNGSLTRKARRTRIGLQALADVLTHAFHWEGVRQWCIERGIRLYGTVIPKGRLTGHGNRSRRPRRHRGNRTNVPQRTVAREEPPALVPIGKLVDDAFSAAKSAKKPKKHKKGIPKASRKRGPKGSDEEGKGKSRKRQQRRERSGRLAEA